MCLLCLNNPLFTEDFRPTTPGQVFYLNGYLKAMAYTIPLFCQVNQANMLSAPLTLEINLWAGLGNNKLRPNYDS